MKSMFRLLLSLVVTLVSVGSGAQEASVCNAGYAVYFGNGVRTEFTSAHGSAMLLKADLGVQYSGQPLSVSVSYNPTSGIFQDLLESFALKRSEDPTLSWTLFFRWVSGQFVNSILAGILDDYFGSQGAARINQAVTFLSTPAAYTDSTVVSHTSTYRSALLAGKKVLVVSHSQGNLYSNAAYGRLSSIESNGINLQAFGIAAVATPANFVATRDTYVTSDSDLIIDAVRLIAPATLVSNDNSVPSFPPADRLGHGFQEIYFSDEFAIKARTRTVVQTSLSRLSTVQSNAANGPLTATLTWSSPGDIDLHAYEPTVHVYYAARGGVVGFLDRDDTTGTGPEHYFARCQNFAVGLYRFGVNYFSGSGSKTATLKLDVLGVSFPSRNVILTTPRGRSGDNSPAILFNVNVTKDAAGNFQATVN